MRRIFALLAFSGLAAFAQTPTITAVVNAASFGTQLCPGLLATVYGTNFGTSAASASVSVGGKPGYVFTAIGYSATQIDVQIPFEAAIGATSITVTVGGTASAPFSITLSAVSPYFQTQSGSGTGLASVYDASAANALVTAAAPAHPGDALFAYVVGLGPTSPATATNPSTGLAAASAEVPTLPTITIGGVAAKVAFAGVTVGGFSAIYQVNFVVPAAVQGTVPLVISIDGVSSSSLGVNAAVVTIAVVSTLVTPTVTSVQNAESFGTQICPGVQALVYGAGFGNTAANVSFTVGGKPGYVISVTTGLMLVQLPFEASTGPTSIVVTVSGVQSPAFNITLSAVSPYLITQSEKGSGLAKVIENAANTLVTLAAPAKVGDVLSTYATGLGPTNPPTATGNPTVANPVATLPAITIGGVAATVSGAAVLPGDAGVYQINFTVPVGVQGTVPIVISTGGVSSSTLAGAGIGPVTIAIAGLSYIESNASFASPGTVSPGSIASVFANNLGASTNVLSGLFPATSSQGVEVTFNGTAAPMFDIIGTPLTAGNPQQIDLLVPSNLPTTGTVNVQLTTPTALYPNYILKMVPSNPAFYRIADPLVPTLINVIAQFANSAWLALPVSTTANLGLPACSSSISLLSVCGQPATIGDTLVLYATGLGLATPSGTPTGTPLPNGQVAPLSGNPLYETPTTPVVTIGGVPATVLFSGLAPGTAGEYQIDVTVPSGIASGDSVPVVLTILGASDSSTTISIQPRATPPPS
jgi:uncharacterized protein (TIGR03437 family)